MVIEAPSILGLFPGGVERLPEALLAAGLADGLGARRGGRVSPPTYDRRRDTVTGVLNPTALRDYAHLLAAATGDVLDRGEIPIVLGGDCSILLGNLLALGRRGRHGLLFIDGHADFYNQRPNLVARPPRWTWRLPRAGVQACSPTSRVADRWSETRTSRCSGGATPWKPNWLVANGSRTLPLRSSTWRRSREQGAARAAQDALVHLRRPELAGVWVHLDCDVVDDALMPAVDYRCPMG